MNNTKIRSKVIHILEQAEMSRSEPVESTQFKLKRTPTVLRSACIALHHQWEWEKILMCGMEGGVCYNDAVNVDDVMKHTEKDAGLL